MKLRYWLLLLSLLAVGCDGDKTTSTQPPPNPTEGGSDGSVPKDFPETAAPDYAEEPAGSEPPEPEKEKYSKVEVFYATDRKRIPNSAPDERYGVERNTEGDHLDYGKAVVTIPESHTPGEIERPKWWKFEFREDPEKHVVLMEPKRLEHDEFYQSIRDSSAARPQKELLMFVHGFNVAWGHAMRRTGQISHDLSFGGVTFCYSWPSQGSVNKYPADKENSEWTIPHLTKVLKDLQARTEFGKVHIIAHSMGTRALTYALANAKDEGITLNLNNIILAAPDMDRDIFKEQILPKIEGHTDLLTMYASSDDEALKISEGFNGSPRLGLSGRGIFVLPDRMDTIDASGIDTSLIGHSYYGSQMVVVKDIFGLVVEGLLPPDRSLKPGDFGEWDLPIGN